MPFFFNFNRVAKYKEQLKLDLHLLTNIYIWSVERRAGQLV